MFLDRSGILSRHFKNDRPNAPADPGANAEATEAGLVRQAMADIGNATEALRARIAAAAGRSEERLALFAGIERESTAAGAGMTADEVGGDRRW